jgi:hypothetical protein
MNGQITQKSQLRQQKENKGSIIPSDEKSAVVYDNDLE